MEEKNNSNSLSPIMIIASSLISPGQKVLCFHRKTLPDGSCVAGYHLIIGSKPPLCRQDTATTTTATQDTGRNLGGLICVKGTC